MKPPIGSNINARTSNKIDKSALCFKKPMTTDSNLSNGSTTETEMTEIDPNGVKDK